MEKTLTRLVAALACISLWMATGCKEDTGSEDDTSLDTAGDTALDEGEDTGGDPAMDPVGEDVSESDDPGEVEPTYDVNGVIEDEDGLEVMRVWGTREEMGYAEGALMCGRITRIFEKYALDYAVAGTGMPYGVVKDFATGFFTIPEDHERQLQAMLLGMQERCDPADLVVTSENLEAGSGGSREITYEDLFVAHVLPDYLCTSLTVWGDASDTGDTIHGRNLDFLLDPDGVFLDEHLLKVYRSSEEGNATWASLSVPALIGCISCVGSEGIGFTMHNAAGLSDDTPTGNIPRTLAMRDALVATVGAADPVAAADAVFDAAPQQMGNNLHMFMGCDGTDCVGAAVFEFDGRAAHADGHSTVRMPGDVDDGLTTSEALVVANHYLERNTPPESGNSYDRHQAHVTAINDEIAGDGTVSVADAQSMLQSTSTLNAGVPTVHSVIMDDSTMTLHVYIATLDADVTEAPYTTPFVVDLTVVFGRFD